MHNALRRVMSLFQRLHNHEILSVFQALLIRNEILMLLVLACEREGEQIIANFTLKALPLKAVIVTHQAFLFF